MQAACKMLLGSDLQRAASQARRPLPALTLDRHTAPPARQGVEWFAGANGSPVLKDGIAYIECTVVTRMETPDHWITYAQVRGAAGKAAPARVVTWGGPRQPRGGARQSGVGHRTCG